MRAVDRHPGGALPHLTERDRPGAGDVVVITGRIDADDLAALSRLHRKDSVARVLVVTDGPGHTPDQPPGGVAVSTLISGQPVAAALSTVLGGVRP